MGSLHVSLFGKFRAHYDGERLEALGPGKVQDLFCFLLLQRERPHSREKLSGMLWGERSAATARKLLRNTLWELQSILANATQATPTMLLVESDWVQLSLGDFLWLDVAVFAKAYASAHGLRGRELNAGQSAVLKDAVQLYQGDLLEGCYQDWCIFERERFQNMYLAVLDKLIGYSESHHDYETGIDYAMKVLLCDRARERTHRRLMRMYYLAGDRTAALRQFDRCAAALAEELAVPPAKATVTLHNQIQLDRLPELTPGQIELDPSSYSATPFLPGLLNRLSQFATTLADMQRQMEQEIDAVILALNDRPKPPSA